MSQTLTFEKWILYGDGFTQSYQAQATVTVTRAYGSDTAHVAVSCKMSSYGGDTNTNWICYVKIGSTWHNWTFSSGTTTHWAGDWYSGSNSWDVTAAAAGGTLTGQIYFRAYDTGASVGANSTVKDWSQTYGTKGASAVSSATNVQLNTEGTATSTVKFTSYSSSFTHKIKATLGSTSTSEVTVAGGNSVNKTATLTFPAAFINQITTAKTGTATISLSTYSGTTLIGTTTKSITLTVPSGINPSVSNIGVTKVSALNQTYFSGKLCTLIDKAQISWTETTQYSSAIASRRTVFNGATSTSASGFTSDILQSSGLNTATVTITDGRGNSGSLTKTDIAVYRYFYPTITSVRYNSNNSLTIEGNIAYVGGDNVPALTLKIYKGEETTGSTIDLTSYLPAATGGTYDRAYVINFTYAVSSEYTPDIATETYRFEVIIADSVSNASTTVYSAVPVMTFGAGGTTITAHKPVYIQKGLYGNNYQSGESFTINGSERYFGGGVLTSSGTKIEFSVPMPKNAIGLTATATVMKLNVWKAGGGYLLASAYTTGGYDVLTDTTLTTVVVGCESYLTIEITKSTAWSDITNNTPIAVEVDALSVSFAQE